MLHINVIRQEVHKKILRALYYISVLNLTYKDIVKLKTFKRNI